jgi:hypothetical protein
MSSLYHLEMSRAGSRTTLNPLPQALIPKPVELTRCRLEKWFLQWKGQSLMKGFLWGKWLLPKGSLRKWLLRKERLLMNRSIFVEIGYSVEMVSGSIAERSP